MDYHHTTGYEASLRTKSAWGRRMIQISNNKFEFTPKSIGGSKKGTASIIINDNMFLS
jgi:hypothetical protein